MKGIIFVVIFVMYGFLYNPAGLHAQQASPQAAAQTLTVNSPAAVIINNGQRVQLTFTAPSAGTYTIESTNNGTLDPVAFSAASGTEKFDDDSGQGNNFRFARELRAGEFFTFFAGFFNNRGTGSYTVIVQGMQSVSFAANAPAAVNINNGQRVQLIFTAPSAGTYTIESTNNGTLDPVAYSAANGTEKIDDDSGQGSNFRFTRELRAGEVFTFFVGFFNNKGTGSYTVSAQGMQSASFAANAPATVTINNGQRVRLSFTAPSAGTYTIESTNNGTLDPVAFSAASGTNKIDDDGGEGDNFRFTRELRAGEVLTFFAGCFNDEGTGSYSVNLFTAYDLEQRILAFEQRVFELTNIERVNHGLPPLIRHELLAVSSRAHSLDIMLNNLGSHTETGHTGSDGSTARQRMVRAGITNGRFYGENISYGSTTPEEVVEGWMNSPGHRANILHTDFTHLGVGLTWRPEGSSARFRIYVVQNFCSFF
jgi:uncharacterized protein YkwD